MLFDLLGATALACGVGYVAVLGSVEAIRRGRLQLRRSFKTAVDDATGNVSLGEKIACLLLSKPEEWSYRSDCVFIHNPSGLEIWAYISPNHVKLYNPESDCFKSSEKKSIWKATRIWIARHETDLDQKARSATEQLVDKHLGAAA